MDNMILIGLKTLQNIPCPKAEDVIIIFSILHYTFLNGCMHINALHFKSKLKHPFNFVPHAFLKGGGNGVSHLDFPSK